MNKSELISKVAEKSSVSKTVAEAVVNSFTSVVSEALAEGDKIQLIGFGTFEVSERAAREARNPHTGETIEVEACRVPKFKAGKTLKEAVNS
jgi:DNA-binding protein HU-beta